MFRARRLLSQSTEVPYAAGVNPPTPFLRSFLVVITPPSRGLYSPNGVFVLPANQLVSPPKDAMDCATPSNSRCR